MADFLQRVAAHDGGAVLLAGEPGIGKSRLAEDTADNAARAGFTVAWGRCRESEGAPPLWPWIQVLRQLHINSVPPAGGDSDPAARFRFFDQVTARLNELCRRSPLLIVLDDVHRADEMSLRLLAFVTDQIWPAPLGLVVAYRTEESADGMWKTVIPGISAYRRTRTLTLAGLDTSDIDEWLRRQRISAPELIPAGLRERSGGNPLFLSEIVRLVQVGRGDHIPPSVLQLMGTRVSGLPTPTRAALDMAALLGRDFGYAALATAPEPAHHCPRPGTRGRGRRARS